jgi:hypothetical protein
VLGDLKAMIACGQQISDGSRHSCDSGSL